MFSFRVISVPLMETFVQENTAEVIFSDISMAENLSGGKAYHSNHLNLKMLAHLTSTPKLSKSLSPYFLPFSSSNSKAGNSPLRDVLFFF